MKLTAQIAGAYFGCEAITAGGKPLGKMYGVSDSHITFNDGISGFNPKVVFIDYCQLLLSPLSEISDEDAIEVAKVCNKDNNSHTFKMKTVSQLIEMGKLISYDLVNNYGDPHYIQLDYAREIVDYLRASEWNGKPKQAYDCGHGSIKSLIEAGIAVKKYLYEHYPITLN